MITHSIVLSFYRTLGCCLINALGMSKRAVVSTCVCFPASIGGRLNRLEISVLVRVRELQRRKPVGIKGEGRTDRRA